VAEDGVFLRGEVIEEGAAGNVRLLADFFDGVAVEPAFGGQLARDGGDRRTRCRALAFAEPAVAYCTIINKVKF
jgi:hypothetical protein